MSESPGSSGWVRPPVPVDRLVYVVRWRSIGTGDGRQPMVSGEEMILGAVLHSYGHYVIAGHRRLVPPTLDRDYSRGSAAKYLDSDSWEILLHHEGVHVASLITVEDGFPGLEPGKPFREAVLPVGSPGVPHTAIPSGPLSELDAAYTLGGDPPALPRVWWCRACARLVPAAELADVTEVADRVFDLRGTHTRCPYPGDEHPAAEHLTAAGLFGELALLAIPHELISTPAVAAGHARRLKLAAALWPAVQVLLAATAPGQDQAGRTGENPSCP